MNKYSLIILSILIVFTGCNKKNYSYGFETSFGERTVYQPNMKIDSFTYGDRTSYSAADSGDQNVFLFSADWGASDQVSDNEYSSSVWFAVDPALTSFSYTDAQLAEHRCYYSGYGAWGGYGFEALDKGTISGTKNNDGSWDVTIDITLKKEEPRLHSSRINIKRTFHEGKYY